MEPLRVPADLGSGRALAAGQQAGRPVVVAPSVCTLALILSAWFDLSVLSGFGSTRDMMVLCYALPVVLVGASWVLPHRRSLRGARIGLGASGVGLALMFSKVLAVGIMILVMCIFLLSGGSYEG
ncbi:hypothetical protein ACFXKR_23885 [Streptomyces violascens]|uniref:hypothetical protein n=1 Tax=Streptomyces violascens TaxID=67381 RepID=UPI0036AF09EC